MTNIGALEPLDQQVDHMRGPAGGRAILEYGDYECPACIQAEPFARHLVETFRERLRFIFRHFPQAEVHPHAEMRM